MSQYICKTCNFKGDGFMGDERCPYDVQCSNESSGDLLYSYKRPDGIQQFIKLCGCASHSKFQNNELLNEIQEWIDDHHHLNHSDLEDKIQELYNKWK